MPPRPPPDTHLETMVRITNQFIHSPLENRKGIQGEKKTGKGKVCDGLRMHMICAYTLCLLCGAACPFCCLEPGRSVPPCASWVYPGDGSCTLGR